MTTPTHHTDAEAAAELGLAEARPLTTSELAELLSMQPQTPRRWRHEGTGPVYIRLGSRVRYRPRDVLAWLDAHRMEHPAREAEEGAA